MQRANILTWGSYGSVYESHTCPYYKQHTVIGRWRIIDIRNNNGTVEYFCESIRGIYECRWIPHRDIGRVK